MNKKYLIKTLKKNKDCQAGGTGRNLYCKEGNIFILQFLPWTILKNIAYIFWNIASNLKIVTYVKNQCLVICFPLTAWVSLRFEIFAFALLSQPHVCMEILLIFSVPQDKCYVSCWVC